MDTETNTIKEFILKLPKVLQDYVLSKTWSDKLTLLEQSNKLDDLQSGALKGEVYLVLTGIENYSDFVDNAQKNVHGVGVEPLGKICADVERDIFSPVKAALLDLEKQSEPSAVEQPKKETILNDIENPTPTRPIVANPVGKNPILDAQHNLPPQEKQVLISSAAVPSRGPILNSSVIQPLTRSFAAKPFSFVPPKQTLPPIQSQPIAPADAPVAPRPAQPIQPVRPAQAPRPQQPIPPAPAKYTVDPYREPAQ